MGMSQNRAKYAAEINVTPFVDVMLVLLIIFMVTAPMLDQGIQVQLPQTKQVDVLPTDSDHLVLTIRKDGKLFLDNYEVALEELEERIQLLVTDKSRALFLQADSFVPYGVVVDIMGRVKSAGIEQLGIVATPSEINATELAEQATSQANEQVDAQEINTKPDLNREKNTGN